MTNMHGQTILKDDLYQINKFKSQFAPKTQLGHLQKFRGPYSFTQMLHRIARMRGSVNVAGSEFKTLFGVAPVMEIDKLTIL